MSRGAASWMFSLSSIGLAAVLLDTFGERVDPVGVAALICIAIGVWVVAITWINR